MTHVKLIRLQLVLFHKSLADLIFYFFFSHLEAPSAASLLLQMALQLLSSYIENKVGFACTVCSIFARALCFFFDHFCPHDLPIAQLNSMAESTVCGHLTKLLLQILNHTVVYNVFVCCMLI